MPEIAGFYCEIDNPDASGVPLLLLHGSGQDENAWSGIAQDIAPDTPLIRLRGNIVWEGKYAFFRRKPDRGLDQADLARSVGELAFLIEQLTGMLGQRKPVLAGYSNGAIACAALARDAGQLTRGAILTRPVPRAGRPVSINGRLSGPDPDGCRRQPSCPTGRRDAGPTVSRGGRRGHAPPCALRSRLG
ncbi:MAG TPA: alpha/beta hydrolase [Rhizobium sp.]|nr:alpha/beta hydrolase [Rhizobium sp.]